MLTSPPVLRHYDPDALLEVHIDASGAGIGAVLSQWHEGDSMKHAVAYTSPTVSKPEQKYTITEKECIAIVWAVGKFGPYPYGKLFQPVTNHHYLC